MNVVAAILLASAVLFYIMICCSENEIENVKREIYRAESTDGKYRDES